MIKEPHNMVKEHKGKEIERGRERDSLSWPPSLSMASTKQWWRSGVHLKRGTFDLTYCLTLPFLPQLPISLNTRKSPEMTKWVPIFNSSLQNTSSFPLSSVLDQVFSILYPKTHLGKMKTFLYQPQQQPLCWLKLSRERERGIKMSRKGRDQGKEAEEGGL